MNALLLGALVFASTSTFVSCKDYDDDITNLQEQINKLSALEKLSTDVTALQTAVQNAQSDATKALDEAKKASDAAAKAATPEQLKAVQDAIAAAEAKIADKADKSTVEALQSLVNENKDKLNGISAEVAEQLEDALKKYALGADVDELAGKVAELEQKINNNQPVEPGEDVSDLTAKYNTLAAQADAMKIAYSTMITNISLVASLQKTYTVQNVWDFVNVKGYYYRNGEDRTDWWTGSDEYMYLYTYADRLRYNIDSELGFTVAEEQDNLFPEDAASVTEQLEFKKGISSVQGDMVLVRVNPTNAVLKPENISLINSQGEELTGLLDCVSAKPYDGLLTRAAGEGTGLWIVTYNLKKDFKNDDLKAAAWDKYSNKILYAVSVKTDAEEENVNTDRRVVSEYDVTLATSNGRDAYDFTVNEKSIWDIHNRYEWSESSNKPTLDVQELNWTGDPAVKAITEGDGLNAVDRYNNSDNRQGSKSLPVVMNEDIVIEYPSQTPIKGFYVTLDYDFAIGDGGTDVSEINAWNSYTYENVGKYKFNGFNKTAVDVPATMFKGNVGTIKIKDLNNVKGDIIGFRVYAVNLDGTLVDPDGRAFYVAIGDEVQNGTEIADKENEYAEIKPVQNADKTYSVQGKSDMLVLDNIEFVKGISTWGYESNNNFNEYSWQASKDNKAVKYNGTTYGTNVTINFYKKDGKTRIYNSQLANAINKGEVVKYQIVVSNLASFYDNEVYAQTMTTYNEVNNARIPVQTVTFQWKKVLPTTIPVDFAFRPKQETVDGSGNFIAYMYPDQENKLDYSVSAFKGVGAKDMRDVFYGLDRNFNFELCTSAKDADKLISKDVVCQDGVDAYPFDVNADFVDSESKHDVNISYNYGRISTYEDAKGVHFAQPWTADYAKNPLTVTYACWETQNKYSWVDKSTATKGLQWTAAGNKVDVMSNTILIKNGYNNDFFGMDMLKATWEKKFLEVVPGSEKLVYNGQVNPYFKPAFSGDYDRITFTQQSIQADANPTADHTEYLVFKVKDCFAHEAEISLPIVIKKAAAATAPAK